MTGEVETTGAGRQLSVPRHLLPLAYLLISVSALLPLALVDTPALVDYPNHLARLYILANLDTDAVLATNYDVVWAPMPNLALDLFALPLLKIMTPEAIGMLFIAVTMLLLMAGTAALHRALHGEIGLWPAAAWFFLYNHLLIMGFLNYLFAVGLALLLFAGWIASAGRPSWVRLVLFPAALIGLYFAHLFALGVYGVCVAGYELPRAWRAFREDWKGAIAERLVIAWQFIPAGLLVLATMPEGGGRSYFYGPLGAKLKALWSPVLTYGVPGDIALLLSALIILIGGFATRRLVLARPIKLPVLLLTAIAIAMPFYIQGAWGYIWYADLRLPTVIVLLVLAGTRPVGIEPNLKAAALSVALVLSITRLYEISTVWRQMDLDFREFRAASEVIEPGAAVLPVQTDGYTPFGYWHLSNFAIMERSAFVPILFTDPVKQLVRAAPRRRAIDSEFASPLMLPLLVDSAKGGNSVGWPLGVKPFWIDWPHRFDYVVIVRFGEGENPLPDILQLAHKGSFFDIYRVSPETIGPALGEPTTSGPEAANNPQTDGDERLTQD